MPSRLYPDPVPGAVDPEPHVVTDEEFQRLLSRDHEERALDRKNNGFADQYKERPISVRKGERVRAFVLNAGPSIWSAFHVIGTVFDRTVIEGQVGRDAQTVNLAPSQGGWVEFTLDEEGTYPFVTHGFGDMVKGALGVLATPGALKSAGH